MNFDPNINSTCQVSVCRFCLLFTLIQINDLMCVILQKLNLAMLNCKIVYNSIHCVRYQVLYYCYRYVAVDAFECLQKLMSCVNSNNHKYLSAIKYRTLLYKYFFV